MGTQGVRGGGKEVGARFALSFSGTGDVFLTKPGPLVETMSAAVRAVTGRTPQLTTTGGTSDARFVKDFCPVIEFGLINETIHQVDERIAVAELERLTEIYERFIAGYFAQAWNGEFRRHSSVDRPPTGLAYGGHQRPFSIPAEAMRLESVLYRGGRPRRGLAIVLNLAAGNRKTDCSAVAPKACRSRRNRNIASGCAEAGLIRSQRRGTEAMGTLRCAEVDARFPWPAPGRAAGRAGAKGSLNPPREPS